MIRIVGGLLVAVMLPVMSAPAQEGEPDSVSAPAPLFESHEIVEFTLKAPFKTIFKDRSQESEELPGTLIVQDEAGSEVTLDVKVRTRGKYRLERRTCGFPPLRVNLQTSQVENTVFASQDKLKLVTHCQDKRSEYEQYVLQEYLIYRVYNLLTDVSFRVRLARVTYEDADGDRDTVTRYAFFIENDDVMAKRSGWQMLKVPHVPPEYVDPRQLAVFEVFQYLIGNTDWSAFLPEPEKPECCHNAKPIGDPAGPVLLVPYDFDMAGIISTRYAKPDPMIGVRSVRDRRFWGICRPREEIDAALPVFNEQRDAIYDLYRNQVGLEEKPLEKTIEYLDEFYEVINDPKKVRNEFVRMCRQL